MTDSPPPTDSAASISPHASAWQSHSLPQRLRRIAAYFGLSRTWWLVAVLATLVAALTEAGIPALLKPLLDRGFTRGTLPLWAVPVTVLLLFVLRGLAGFVAQYALSRIANDGMIKLRRDMFARLLDADLALFARQSASSLSNTIVYEVQNGAHMLVQALLGLSRDAFTLVALLGYLLYLNWQLTTVVLVLAPAMSRVMRTLSHRLYGLTKQGQRATDDLAYVVEENVLAHRMVRLYGAQQQQATRFAQLSARLRQLSLKSTIAGAAMTPLTQAVAAVALAFVFTIALWQAQSAGEVASAQQVRGATVGGFVAFVAAMMMLVAPIRRLTDVANPITRGVAALERGLAMVEDVPPEARTTHPTSSVPAPADTQGDIRLDNVQVRYRPETPAHTAPTDSATSLADGDAADDDAPALQGVNLHIRSGEVVAFVGPSGSGKTTLVNLLPRFVQPTSGTVWLDGVPLPDWPLDALRARIALVSQDVVMLNQSIAANVALGQTVDADRVRAALDAANLLEHVNKLPAGIDTIVGHNATQLSGGQRQRLAIARAIYKNAPILILDEATSALDNASERLVQQALQRLMQGRTTLIVAHRLSTIEHADRVIVMESGRIVEQGTHAELLRHNGIYARLHHHQPPPPPAN